MAESSTPHRGNFVAYYRVSTDRQGESGLGLDAQKKAVRDFLDGGSWELIREFTEVESGKRSDRPELAAALDLCRKRKATLIIAKLDRLSRNVAFIAALLDSNVKFKCADMPEADRTFLQMVAVFAEWQRGRISQRTKEALAAAKARGVKLGGPRAGSQAGRIGAATNKAQAEAFAANVLPIIKDEQQRGAHSLRQIVEALTARGIKTARGGAWSPVMVASILKRAS